MADTFLKQKRRYRPHISRLLSLNKICAYRCSSVVMTVPLSLSFDFDVENGITTELDADVCKLVSRLAGKNVDETRG
jgi:hypothetical protein